MHVILEGKGVELLFTLFFPPCIGGHPQEFQVADTRNFNGVLKSEEHPQTGPLFRLQLKQILAAITNAAARDPVGRMPGQHLGERALATAVATHHGMDFTSLHLQIDALEDGLVLDGGMQVLDVEQQLSVRANHGRRR